MMAIHGKRTEVYANGWKISDYFNSIETEATVDTAETTVFNSSNVKTYIPGKSDATLSGEGLFGGGSSGVDSELSRALASSSDVLWLIYPEGSAIGQFGYGLETIETSYGITAPVDDVVSTSVDGQSVLGRDRVESLKSISVVTANTGVETVDDNTSASTNGATAYLQKVENVRNLTSAAIEDSNNNSTFAALFSFTASTGKTAERLVVAGDVKRYTRVTWQQAASTAAGEFTIGFTRKD